MTKVQQFLDLHAQGLSVGEIAARMNVRFQHVYNELRRYRRIETRGGERPVRPAAIQPKARPLAADALREAGFANAAKVVLAEDGELAFATDLPAPRGVYAICVQGQAQYVGLASMGIAARMKFYLRPGATQRTSTRLNGLLKALLSAGGEAEVLVAFPDNHTWNGLPMDGCAGLESALIAAYDLPWNIRGARKG